MDEYREYYFEVSGKVYATSYSHARHFMYWAMEEAEKYKDASHGYIRIDTKHMEGDDNE